MFLGMGPNMELGPDTAAILIRQDCVARKLVGSEDNLVVVLGVDEINHVLLSSAEPLERRRSLTPLIRALGASLCRTAVTEQEKVFICPLLTGTVIGDAEGVIAASSHSAIHLKPSPLTADEVHEIVISRKWAASIISDRNLNRTLEDFGGVPLVVSRFIELVEEEIRDCREAGAHVDGVVLESLRRRTLERMLESTKSLTSFPRQLKGVAVAAIEGRGEWLPCSEFGGITLESLQANGALSIGGNGMIQMPIIYLVSKYFITI